MNWKAKALLHWLIPLIPYHNHVHYWFQRSVAKTLPMRPTLFRMKVEMAQSHVDCFHSYSVKNIEEAVFFEIGTGWELAVQLTFYSLGVNKQITVDVKPALKAELVNESMMRLQKLGTGLPTRRLPRRLIEGDLREELRAFYGIDYRAPYDAKKTRLNDGTIDFITSTDTFQHIPEPELVGILRECRRILHKDGIMSLAINYDDHYSFSDPGISLFNFLKYSDFRWRFANPPTHFQNRLRHSDYVSLFHKIGFKILSEVMIPTSEDDRRFPINASLAPKFKTYPPDVLFARHGHFVLRKEV